MRSPQQILTVALALSPLAAAWSQWLPDIDSLVVRQDDGSSTSESQATKTPSPESSATADAPEETGTAKPTQSSKGDDDSSSTGTATGTSTKGSSKTTKSSSSKHTSFNALDPAGGVAMISPPTTSAMPLYRIDNTDPITWKWNYTSLQGTPSAIDVLISCSKATASWTLTQNMTFAPTATFTWDSNKYQQEQIGNQLPVEQYTLLIYDADGSPTDTADPGYLAPYAGFQFGLYTSKPYSNLNEWKCVTCSAAPGGPLDRQALGFAVTMTMFTVLSFTWYVTGITALI
ncbi:hypothetical protein O1611_g9897 [Lasiodiplodia mahajangana]|uniref:Uncharacterized protein n=1 Tax=Lasiodiplodia mahajangana TaxID=1108764 RepID=A0ACC2J458_9PEZI|nr:hypothetical protein O1611_g9897 [Lasiodiplodia mahajangana]